MVTPSLKPNFFIFSYNETTRRQVFIVSNLLKWKVCDYGRSRQKLIEQEVKSNFLMSPQKQVPAGKPNVTSYIKYQTTSYNK